MPSQWSVRISFRLRSATVADRDPEEVSPVANAWPCWLAVDVYTKADRELEFPRPDCPACVVPLTVPERSGSLDALRPSVNRR